ncbi:MAG TPA: tRNA epoxyqueuosine(34) reductase QueG [Anaerolineae bacterium]|nr:tRNA epoxyqueuosine(34) reductase QueG [Anaerolineae bacterium]
MANVGDVETIKERAHDLGFDLVGVAPARPSQHGEFLADWLARGYAGTMGYLQRNVERRLDPRQALPGARSIVAVGMNYSTAGDQPADPSHGRISCYAWGDDYHDLIEARLRELLGFIQREAGREIHGRVYVDTGPVLEREVASRAGLGWIGKNTNLIHPRWGSWLFLGEILLDIELAPDEPWAADRCGTCIRCLEACPTGALVAPRVLDARRCISYLTIELKGSIPRDLRPPMGNWIFGCDLCQEVCPWNRRSARPTGEWAFWPREGLDAPPLLSLMGMDDEEFRSRFRGSPIKRVRRRGLLRNVAVALGNWGDEAAVPALARALDDPEPLVREHAAWALGRIGGKGARRALEGALVHEDDPSVRAEIRRALEEM